MTPLQVAWFAVGLVLALIGAAFMIEGSILGERTTGIATVMAMVGITLIATSGITITGKPRKPLS